MRRSHEASPARSTRRSHPTSLEEDLELVVALLGDRKRRIWFAGGRFSQLVANYLCLQLRMLRPGCAMVAESNRPAA